MSNIDEFLDFTDKTIGKLEAHKQIAIACEVDDDIIVFHEEIIEHCRILQGLINKYELSFNYLNQFRKDILQILNFFPYKDVPHPQSSPGFNKTITKSYIETPKDNIKTHLELLKFNLDFFEKLGFFNHNIVAIGANGSGKTSLSNKLKSYIRNNGVVVSAQRVLLVPKFETLHSPLKTSQDLKNTQSSDKSNKDQKEFQILQNEFAIVLQNLLANNIASGNTFRLKAIKDIKNGKTIDNAPVTNLDIALDIWNSLIEHRIISCDDGMYIMVHSKNVPHYPAMQMSDGEKVVLFLIAQVLQAPNSGFIIIDEPEMYLHKTILKKLFDILERERQDCIFVYLTHDLDFAVSRATAKKIWIRSFLYPDKWHIEDIPENDLPEPLLLELLGSRKNILFCEGKKGGIDEKIYNILFPDFTITPVNGCLDVINYTKAFNKLPNPATKAFGIIDSDHHENIRLEALKPFNIHSFSMVEPENLFLDEDFLKMLMNQLMVEEGTIEKIKTAIIKKLSDDLELQISNYVSAKVNFYFKESHVSHGNALENVMENYEKFTNTINIQSWYDQRKIELNRIIIEKDYPKVLSIFNNKGLKYIVNKHLNISDFTERAIKLLQFQPSSHKILKKYYPKELLI
jgi:ABC-type cobalamin/Fe3+-siderophores transport system ATPase subunit